MILNHLIQLLPQKESTRQHKWTKSLMVMKGPYTIGVHCPFIYIYIKELPIYKKESGCIPPRLGDTLSDSSRFDFENLTQSETRSARTTNEWTQKRDGGPYNGADSVHWPSIYIYNGKTSISKKESDACLCAIWPYIVRQPIRFRKSDPI